MIMKKEKIFTILLDYLFNFLGCLEMIFENFFKILVIITFMILIFKTFSYLNSRLEKYKIGKLSKSCCFILFLSQ